MERDNSKAKRIRIGVIFGGRSGEHEVSQKSARSVINALNPEKYDVVMIGITKNGRWLTGNVAAALEAGQDDVAQPAALLPDPQSSGLMQITRSETRPASLSEVAQLDVIFPVLHGPYGEDGTVQGLLELAGLPYIGAGVVGSAVGMDKAIFKNVMVANSLPILPWQLLLRSEWQNDPEQALNKVESALKYPVFTKPANLGSSVGSQRCHDRDGV
jgi:D-alanine-D-alanine ligase